jgi:hypothetical protein
MPAPRRQPDLMAVEPLEKRVDHLLEECRMVLPGVQALFGFQLMAVFNPPFFTLLSFGERLLHLGALVLVALAIAFLMAPATYHRQAEPDGVSVGFVRYASRLLMAAMVPLMVALTMEVYLIARLVLERRAPSLVLALIVFVTFAAIWFVWPWISRRTRRRAPAR